jgi:heat shock protein HslJ
MKISILLLLIFGVTALFVSCSNDDACNCSGEIIGKWEVEEFMSVESVLYAKDKDYSPFVEFNADGSFEIHLDINVCSGTFELLDESGIKFSDIGCTEACCDSDFSEKFIEMLPQVTTYSIEDEELRLIVSGWGWIQLEFVSE